MNFIAKMLVFLGIVTIGAGSVYFYIDSKNRLDFDIKALAKTNNIIPVAVIGSGAAGLGAGVYSSRAGLYTVIFSGSKPGGLLTETTDVENWPGEKNILGPKIIENLKSQNLALGVKFVADTIETINTSTWPFELITGDGDKLKALSVIIATGATPKRLNIVGEQQYWSKGVSACAICDAPFYKDRDVIVVGGGDSAMEEALQLSSYAKSVTVFVRKDKARASNSMQKRAREVTNINIEFNKEVTKVLGDGQSVTSVQVKDNKLNKVESRAIDGLFLAIGYDPNTNLVKDKLDLDKSGYIKVSGRTQKSSIDGIFSAGEVDDNIYRQACIACAEGNKAALDADRFLQDIGVNSDLLNKLANKFYDPKSVNNKKHVFSINTLGQFKAEVEQSDLPAIMDFWTPNCPTCKHMLPAFEALAEKYSDKIKFIKINADNAEDLVRKFFVMKVPCFIVYQNGRLAARNQSFMSKKEMNEFILKFIN